MECLLIYDWTFVYFDLYIPRIVVTQPYNPEILTEYVIRGNSAILKCSIPSYIAEFVTVEAWIREDEEVYLPEDPALGQGTTRSLAVLDYFTNVQRKIYVRMRVEYFSFLL